MRISKGILPDEEYQSFNRLFGKDGYGREFITSQLDLEKDIESKMFGNPDWNLCVFGYDESTKEAIAFSLAASLPVWMEEFSNKMDSLDDEKMNDNTKQFINFYRQVLEDEKEFVEIHKNEGTKIAIRCGLTVRLSHSQHGYGTKLIEESNKYLKELGYEYILVHATSEYSQRIFQKNGYISVHKYNLSEWFDFNGIAMNMLCIL